MNSEQNIVFISAYLKGVSPALGLPLFCVKKEGSCVIVGRCADFILRDKADCLKVFVHASMEHRVERIVKEYGELGIDKCVDIISCLYK